MSNSIQTKIGWAREIYNAVTMCFLSLDYYGRQENIKEVFLKKFQTEVMKDIGTLLLRQIATHSGHQVAAQISSIQEFLTTELLQNFDPNFYKFRLNPQELTFSERKIQSVVVTNRGIDTWNWGNELDIWTYRGTSGYMKPPRLMIEMGIQDLRFSPAWMRFEMFKKFFEANDGEMVMFFEDKLMKCYMNEFSFTRNADNPWRIDFNFTVRADSKASIDMLSGDISGFFEKEKDLFEDSWKGELL